MIVQNFSVYVVPGFIGQVKITGDSLCGNTLPAHNPAQPRITKPQCNGAINSFSVNLNA